ncbi:MAG: ABC transporter substrate-binding protein [Ilumatobacteraceae bacterium]
MRTKHRTRHVAGRWLAAATISLGLVAAACSKKDDNSSDTKAPTATSAGSTATTGAGTGATGGTETTTGGGATTAATTTTVAETEKPTTGGSIIVSGEAETANPWTPAAMQCDSYCQQRARTFFDPVAAFGSDNQVHGVLAESITPNADYSQWTIKIRSGINFTDGTPVNADAVMRNLNETGTGLLIAGSLVDVAKNADKTLKMEKVDDQTFTIFMGKGGDPNTPLSWPGFPTTLTNQFGLIASPAWLDAVKADPTKASQPIGSGPFIVQSYAPRDSLVVTRNPNYWQKDADGVQLPYLDKITFRVIEDAKTAEQALKSGDIDIFSTSGAQVIQDFRDVKADFPMSEQSQYTETNYILIDLDKAGPLQDARVRCAMSMAIDRQEVNDLVYGGILQIANGLFSPGQQGYLADNGFDTDQNLDEAQKLIDDYKASTGASSIDIHYGATADSLAQQAAELYKGYWSKIGIDTTIDVVPQDKIITNALLGDSGFYAYGWRNHAGLTIDQQNYWWNSASAAPDGQLALNFGRLRDSEVDADLATARSDPDEATRTAAAEDVNRTMAKNCYQIPTAWTLWGTPHKPTVMGLGATTLPDGTQARDGAGFSGQFWMTSMWVKS